MMKIGKEKRCLTCEYKSLPCNVRYAHYETECMSYKKREYFLNRLYYAICTKCGKIRREHEKKTR
jgi:hypothetical protein